MTKSEDPDILPVLKWAGGKRLLRSEIIPLIPDNFSVYCEPFLGGGAILFGLKPKRAVVNDINSELINVYEVIKKDVESLIDALSAYENTEEFYFDCRNVDRSKYAYDRLSDVEKAARVIYLNKTCFNGLYRVNGRGEFNVPYGKYKKPKIVDKKALMIMHKYLNNSKISFNSTDYKKILNELPKGSFVYLDPPYDPISKTASFTSYAKDGFGRDEQKELRKWCDKLDKRGIKFLLSNSKTDFILEQYEKYNIKVIEANRFVNANGKNRKKVEEVLIRNYE